MTEKPQIRKAATFAERSDGIGRLDGDKLAEMKAEAKRKMVKQVMVKGKVRLDARQERWMMF